MVNLLDCERIQILYPLYGLMKQIKHIKVEHY